jgi:hypothetical protein
MANILRLCPARPVTKHVGAVNAACKVHVRDKDVLLEWDGGAADYLVGVD